MILGENSKLMNFIQGRRRIAAFAAGVSLGTAVGIAAATLSSPADAAVTNRQAAAYVIETALEMGMGALDAAVLGEIALHEGYRDAPYLDIVGKKTWCFGDTVGRPPEPYTLHSCTALFIHRVGHDYAEPVASCTEHWDSIPILAQKSVVEIAYNIGVGRYCRSSIRQYLDEGRGSAACERILLYNKAGPPGAKKVIPYLDKRRKQEAELCRQGFR